MAVMTIPNFSVKWAQMLEEQFATHILFFPQLLQYPPNGHDEHGSWLWRTDVVLNDKRVFSARFVWIKQEARAEILVIKFRMLAPYVRDPKNAGPEKPGQG